MREKRLRILFIDNPARAAELLALFDDGTEVRRAGSIGGILRLMGGRGRYGAVVTDAFGRHGALALLASTLLKSPLVLRVRGEFFREEKERLAARKGFLRWPRYLINVSLAKACFSMADLAVVNSEYMKEAMGPWLRDKAVAVVRNPYIWRAEGRASKTGLPKGRLNLLTVTNMNLASKIDPVIEAAEGWLDRKFFEDNGIYWAICGHGYHYGRLKEAVESKGLDERILLAGWADEIDPYYDWCDVLVHLTRIDAFPNSTMEAMMKRKPVVTNSGSCGTREQVYDGVNGFVIDGKEAFTEALKKYLADSGLRAAHGGAGKRLVEERFTAEVQRKEMARALCSLEPKKAGLSDIAKKAELAQRLFMVRALSGVMPLYIVNEYPKSGGTWVGQMLGAALGVPFPRNSFPGLRPSIMYGHYLRPYGMRNVVLVWRDGRDVMVSWYHHCLFPNEHGNRRLVEMVRKDLRFKDYEDIEKNLPEFIDYSFTRQRSPAFSWAEFVRKWHGRPGVVSAKYEDLRRDTAGGLARIYGELTGKELCPQRAAEISEEFSFARLAGRKPGVELKGSFMRKGIVGDWENSFSPIAREVFDRHAGEELIALGYEPDRSWVRSKGLREKKA